MEIKIYSSIKIVNSVNLQVLKYNKIATKLKKKSNDFLSEKRLNLDFICAWIPLIFNT